ncbi:MAG: carbohydrate ABC transporter permease [Sulfobacillus benefaciens]|uniref:Carbohydrate ABC transporter permease n=1 Tax=Sulfobacillus benefaciens TaxID=453960 RepID=A0A2T2XCQ3_9FIRM|nr:MAG: carbohydrate ABC transporter permease [Sulfobacillus benefaciens]
MRQAVRVGLGVIIIFWCLAPIYWALVVSLATPLQVNIAQPFFYPHPVTFRYFAQLLSWNATSRSFLRIGLNSIIEAGMTTMLTVVIATMAGYAFARMRFRGQTVFFFVIVGTISLPAYAVIVPLFQMMSQWNLVGTYTGVILVEISAALPLATWLMRSYIASLPTSIEESARIDGANLLTALRQVILPLIGPGMASTTIVVFLMTWSQFIIPLTFAPASHAESLTVLITQFVTKDAVDYGLQAAAGILALIPAAILVVRYNRRLVSGLLTGAVTS